MKVKQANVIASQVAQVRNALHSCNVAGSLGHLRKEKKLHTPAYYTSDFFALLTFLHLTVCLSVYTTFHPLFTMTVAKQKSVKRQVVRLHVRGRVLGYQRGIRVQHPNRSLLQLEDVNTKDDALFYLGKRVAFVYRAKKSSTTPRKGDTQSFKNEKGEPTTSTKRVIWGTITRPHGNSGVVRAKFRNNLPASSFGCPVRVMLYPSNV
jgi:large subunit ribosomal protein L35Ae